VLRAIVPSPVVDVNRALAVAMCEGALAGLDELDAIPERPLLARYPYALAAYAELHGSLGDLEQRAPTWTGPWSSRWLPPNGRSCKGSDPRLASK